MKEQIKIKIRENDVNMLIDRTLIAVMEDFDANDLLLKKREKEKSVLLKSFKKANRFENNRNNRAE